MALAARTLISRSGNTLLELVTAWSKARDTSNTILFSISPSPTLPQAELSELVRVFTSQPNTIGCLSSPLNLERTNDMNLQKLKGKGLFRGDGEGMSVCSWAEFDGQKAKVFRSTISGRPVTQVGRWHKAREIGMKDGDAGEGFSGEMPPPIFDGESWPRRREAHSLPEEIKNMDSENLNTVIYLSDTAPEGISQSLTKFRKATTVGLMATSTPFITGRPFTLLYNNEIHSSGAVGICLEAPSPPRHKLVFPALRALTKHFTVTSSEGNLVHTLNDDNPTEILIKAIKKHKMLTAQDVNLAFREWNFYLATTPRQAPEQVFRINSADPGRGTIALEGDIAPPVGSKVQMLSLPIEYLNRPLLVLNRPNARIVLNFHTTLSDLPQGVDITVPVSIAHTRVIQQGEDYADLKGMFIASSEHGCILSRLVNDADGEHKEIPWKAGLPLGNMSLAFD